MEEPSRKRAQPVQRPDGVGYLEERADAEGGLAAEVEVREEGRGWILWASLAVE